MVYPLIAGFVLGATAAAILYGVRRRPRRRSAAPDERISELSQLAGGLAHELRNPLSTLMVNLTLLGEDLRAADQIDEQVQRRCLAKIDSIRAEADRLNRLFDSFLGLVGPCTLDRGRADVNRTTERLVDFITPEAQSAGIRIHTVYAREPLECEVDEGKIEQALLNIVVNAQQAMSAGGELMFRTRRQEQFAVIEISDTGQGMNEQTQARVFEPFFSTKKRGTGLGLPTTRRIINEHGGTIDLHSEAGKGTRFVIRLPLARSGNAGSPGRRSADD